MGSALHLVIQALASHHQRANFHCGQSALDRYLHKQARQDEKRRVSRVFVATTRQDPNTIVGYYTLSSLSIELNELPAELARKLPRHPIPAALLGRLAVSLSAQGLGIGGVLLADALKRCLAVSDEIAIYALVVDAIDDSARAFYQQYGFEPLSARTRRLFLPLKSLQSVP